MNATITTREQIDEFLEHKRLAVVGVSRNPQDFTRQLFRDLRQRGYDLVPVNPNATEIEGQPCFAHVQDIVPPVEGVLVMTAAQASEEVVRDCAKAGVSRVWLHRGAGIGAVSQNAVDFCQQNGIGVVAGFCPYMFLPETAFIHRLHGFGKKLIGSYPR